MNDNATVGAIKRRWWVIVLFAVIGGVLGALPEPAKVDEQERTFTATHTLVLNETDNQSGTSVVSPNQVTLFVSTGEVPSRAAAVLDFSGNPASLSSQVESEFDLSTGAFTISTTGTDPGRVELVADTFADELTSYLAERQDAIYQARLAASLDRLSTLEEELSTITRDLSRDEEDPILIAQQGAISRRYSVAFEQSESLEENPPVIGFTTLQRAQAVEVTESGLGAPRSRMSRGILGAIVGAALGLGATLLLGLLDRKIRTREQAEELVGMRARVLIPKVRDKTRDQIVVLSDRHDALSDSYRTVRNVVAFVNGGEPSERAPITLVVSPSPGDGKTTLAANLAAASAEAGQRTVLVNADFRRPRLTTIFGSEAGAPLPFLLEDIGNLNAATLLTRSGIDRIRLLDLVSVPGSSGDLARASASKLDELAHVSDSVIIDSSPIGATAEVLDLVPYADVIVMVARVGHTTKAQAERAIGILRDLTTAPILLVLGGLKHERTHYYEYANRPRPKTRKRWRWFSGRRASNPEDDPAPLDNEDTVADPHQVADPEAELDDDLPDDSSSRTTEREHQSGDAMAAAGSDTEAPDATEPGTASVETAEPETEPVE